MLDFAAIIFILKIVASVPIVIFTGSFTREAIREASRLNYNFFLGLFVCYFETCFVVFFLAWIWA